MNDEETMGLRLAALFSVLFILFLFSPVFRMIGWEFSNPTESLCEKDGGVFLGEFGWKANVSVNAFNNEWVSVCQSGFSFRNFVCNHNGENYTVLASYFGHRWRPVNSEKLCVGDDKK